MSKKKITVIVLGSFLILSGLAGLVGGLGGLGVVIAILALAAGVLLLVFTPGISINIGWILAASYMILRGLVGIISLSFTGMNLIMNLLALTAGILLLIRMPKIRKNIGYLLFFIWLILVGLIGLVGFGPLGVIVHIVALAGGIVIILSI
jgi:hypothetical protein